MTDPVFVPMESIEAEEDNEPPSIMKGAKTVFCPSFQFFFPSSRCKTDSGYIFRQDKLLYENQPYGSQELCSAGCKVLTMFSPGYFYDSAVILAHPVKVYSRLIQ